MKKNQIIIIIALILSVIAIIISVYAISMNSKNLDSKTEKKEKYYRVLIKKDVADNEIDDLIDRLKNNSGLVNVSKISKEETANNIKNKLGENYNNYIDSNSFSDSISILCYGTEKEISNIKKMLEKETIVDKVEER